MRNTKTRAWELYEQGRDYNERLTPSQYVLVETNTEFFTGNQWLRLPDTPGMRGLPKPVFNILKRVASLFIASLTSSGAAVRLEPMAYYGGGEDDRAAAEAANAELAALLERLKFDYRIRDALFDGAVSGDYCAHFFFDPAAAPYRGSFRDYRGEIGMELVDGINVMFGNPNDRRVQEQPYILIVGRDTVANLRAEAEAYGGDVEAVVSDTEYERMPGQGGKTELDGKALYLYLYEKREGAVRVTKATRDAVIYEDIDTGLARYPVAWGNWEKQKNQYHGRALVTGLIPNQIFINSMFATAMRHLQLSAFPKTVYNADLISRWDGEVGGAIGVHGLPPGAAVNQVAANLAPAEMSAQIFAFIDKVMAYTKECLGATDAQMGNVRPDNTSALMVLQTNAEVPLENVRAGLYEWVEDIAAILLDMMAAYYGQRPVALEREFREPVTGPGGAPELDENGAMALRSVRRRVLEAFDFSRLREMEMNLRVDVGATTYFSEIAMTQTLDNLRRDGTLDVVSYLERLPDKLIPRKRELLDALRDRSAAAETPKAAAGGFVQGGALDAEKAAAGLAPALAAKVFDLPGAARKAALRQGARRVGT